MYMESQGDEQDTLKADPEWLAFLDRINEQAEMEYADLHSDKIRRKQEWRTTRLLRQSARLARRLLRLKESHRP